MSATECSECNVVLLLTHTFKSFKHMYFLKALKTLGNQYCNGFKTPRFKLCAASCLLCKESTSWFKHSQIVYCFQGIYTAKESKHNILNAY